MSLWKRRDESLDSEIRDYVDRETKENIEAGMEPEAARHAALRKLGRPVLNVKEDTRADILWHVRPGMTAHYSEAQIREIRAALELIKDETGRQNRSLRSLAKEARKGLAINERVPSGSLQQEKTA